MGPTPSAVGVGKGAMLFAAIGATKFSVRRASHATLELKNL